MSIFRPGVAGLLLLLGACSAPAVRPPKAAVSTVAPSTEAAGARPAPMAMAMAMAAALPAPAPARVTTAVAAAASEPLPAQAAASRPAVVEAPELPLTHLPDRPRIAARPVTGPGESRSVAAAAPGRWQLSGQVELSAARGQQVGAGEQADTLVYFEPSDGAGRVKPGQFTVYTHNRDFSPEAIAIPLGSTVTFVNLDDVRHNVFSVSPGSTFDLGYQGSGEKALHTFTQPGVVLIGCNVHRSMELDMLVVGTPYVGKVSADGSFTLRGLPAGRGTLHFWNPRAQPVSRVVTLPMAEAVTQKLVAIKPRMDTQLDVGTAP